jgi:hypothetical protein
LKIRELNFKLLFFIHSGCPASISADQFVGGFLLRGRFHPLPIQLDSQFRCLVGLSNEVHRGVTKFKSICRGPFELVSFGGELTGQTGLLPVQWTHT